MEAEGDVENPQSGSIHSSGSINDNDPDAAAGLAPSSTSPAAEKRNINSYYGHKIGFLQTLSLTLNAGLMVYAHLGLSAVILSSKDPSITANLNTNDGGSAGDTQTVTTVAPITNDTLMNNGTAISDLVVPGDGKCNAQDVQNWISAGGEETRGEKSNYCSREYNGGCFLNGDCIEECFQEVHGYSEECSTCFGVIPSCSIANDCMMPCASDSLGEECNACNTPCIQQLSVCTGLPEVKANDGLAGKCNAQDVENWIEAGGEETRGVKSNYCSREYNGGCFLNSDCIEECFQEVHGYSEECSTCFGVIPSCSIANDCMMPCASDSLGEECNTCNTPCIEELSVCTGLPNIDDIVPEASEGGKCNAQDTEIWITNEGEVTRPAHSNFCSTLYNGGGCAEDDNACIEACFRTMFGYSAECAGCFGDIPSCYTENNCTAVCAEDSFSTECNECSIPCTEELGLCTGFPDLNANLPSNNETDAEDTVTPLPPNEAIVTGGECNEYDLEAIDTWYNVYNLTFVASVNDAWNGDAKLLAVIVVVFSGIWPYLKNIMLVMIWYIPATEKTQTSTLLWLSRLSKYTLVDVFAVIGVLVGVQLQLNVGGTEAVTRAEPRFGIIAFFLATVWEFLQIELIKAMYERKVLGQKRFEAEAGEDRLLFSKLWIPVIILAASLGLYISGAITEIVYFASTDIGTNGVCKKSYNLLTLGNALINELSMTSNSAPGQTWILYLSYVILNLAFPILTHTLQICFIIGWFRSKKLKRLIEWTLAIWCFACIEVLLIGIFAVEYKFPNLIMKIAGDTNSSFLDIDSNLGTGFYILIAYSVVAGFLQYSLRIRPDESGQPSSQEAAPGGKEHGSI